MIVSTVAPNIKISRFLEFSFSWDHYPQRGVAHLGGWDAMPQRVAPEHGIDYQWGRICYGYCE